MTLTKLGALVAGAVLVFGACSSSGSTAAPSSGGTSAAPAAGNPAAAPPRAPSRSASISRCRARETANGGPTFNGIQLAVDEANAAGGVAGYKIEINKQDDAVNGAHDPKQGASNAQTLVADEAVVGMVGPFNSNVARAQIPVTNEAGLAQCSPANTGVDLTKEGSDKYRPKNPDKRNYFRVATPDDIQGPAGAQYAFNDLKKTKAWVVDDTEAFGVGVANSFTDEFKKLGGTIVKRDGNDFKKNTDFASLINAVKASNPDVVYFGGTQVTGGGQLKQADGPERRSTSRWSVLTASPTWAPAARRARSSPSPVSRTRATRTAPSPASTTSPIPKAFADGTRPSSASTRARTARSPTPARRPSCSRSPPPPARRAT